MTAKVLPRSVARHLEEPTDPLDWCLAHSRPASRSLKQIEPRKSKQPPPLDLTFWGKSREELRALVQARNEVEKHVPHAARKRKSVLFEPEREEWWENDGSTQITQNTQHKPIRYDRVDHPRWNPRGSTIVRVNGRDIDMAALPDCICKPFFLNYRQLVIRNNRNSQAVTNQQVEDAQRILEEKKDACQLCNECYWPGFGRMREIALQRQFKAQLRPELRMKRPCCRKSRSPPSFPWSDYALLAPAK